MMRKDVKLGLAIGGVLLAVIVVYVLVGTGGGTDKTTVANNSSNDSKSGDSNNGGANPAAVVTEDHSASVGDAIKRADAGAENKPAINAPAPKPEDAAASANKNGDQWGAALNDGHLMMTQTPSAPSADIPGGGEAQKRDPSNAAANTSAINPTVNAPNSSAPAGSPTGSNEAVSKSPGADSIAGGPSTQPTDSAGNSAANGPMSSPESPAVSRSRTHVIQKGETFASIAQMAYGNASYFPAIKRANPTIDERKLKPGMTIVLPPIDEVKPDARSSAGHSNGNSADHTAAQRASAEIPAGSSDTYRVASGDTLERIAIKLYGKREMKDKIYELNKDSIGADPNKLKLNQVLKLPSPPTTGK